MGQGQWYLKCNDGFVDIPKSQADTPLKVVPLHSSSDPDLKRGEQRVLPCTLKVEADLYLAGEDCNWRREHVVEAGHGSFQK